VRRAASFSSLPIYVTENGIGTDDDDQRIRYLTGALQGLHACSTKAWTYAATSSGRCSTTSSGPSATAQVRHRERGPHHVRTHAQALGSVVRDDDQGLSSKRARHLEQQPLHLRYGCLDLLQGFTQGLDLGRHA